jgi:hypothetical protein
MIKIRKHIKAVIHLLLAVSLLIRIYWLLTPVHSFHVSKFLTLILLMLMLQFDRLRVVKILLVLGALLLLYQFFTWPAYLSIQPHAFLLESLSSIIGATAFFSMLSFAMLILITVNYVIELCRTKVLE